jgi:hypothetical protein
LKNWKNRQIYFLKARKYTKTLEYCELNSMVRVLYSAGLIEDLKQIEARAGMLKLSFSQKAVSQTPFRIEARVNNVDLPHATPEG